MTRRTEARHRSEPQELRPGWASHRVGGDVCQELPPPHGVARAGLSSGYAKAAAEALATMLHRVLVAHDGYHANTCESSELGYNDADLIAQGDGDDSCDCGDIELREEARKLLKSWPFTSDAKGKP